MIEKLGKMRPGLQAAGDEVVAREKRGRVPGVGWPGQSRAAARDAGVAIRKRRRGQCDEIRPALVGQQPLQPRPPHVGCSGHRGQVFHEPRGPADFLVGKPESPTKDAHARVIDGAAQPRRQR